MSLKVVLHPDVFDFLRQELSSDFKDSVLGCIEKLKRQQFDGGLRAKKLKGINSRVWEARIDRAIRLIFTYVRSTQPETGKPETYIAIQDILEHDDVSRRSRARKITVDCQWLDIDNVVETSGDIVSEIITSDEQDVLNQWRFQDLQGNSDDDELLGNIQWRMLSSEEEWRRAIVDREIDLPLKLTPEEYELINTQGHLLLSGSAGTGKTTVGLYRLCKSLENLQSGKRLYTAYNRILVANSEEQFVRLANQENIQTESIFQFKTIKDLCLDILSTVGKSYRLEDEVTYQVFEQLYCRRPDRDKPYPSAFIWDEIRSIIKGAHLDTDSYSLSKVKYEELGEKRSSIVPKRDRHKVYKVSEWYQAYLKNEGRFDEIDLARDALQVIKKGKHDRYQLIVCDEVQDFTELQLKLLVSLVEPTGTLFFAGDLHQMISPSGFRWGDLKKNFFGKQNQTTEKTLQFNFRSVGSLVNLANQLLKLRSRLLGESVKESEKQNSNYGETARLITAPLENLKTSFGQLNPDDAILVRNDENKQIFRKELNSSFVFTIEEAKGLEFDTVVLVDFFKHRQLLWNKVLDTTRKLMDINIPELRLELNLLYVAVTRARRILNIWETQRSSIWEQKELINFVNSIDSESVRKDQIEPTTKMWVDRGVYYRDAGFYEQAIECFKKSGDEKLQISVEVKILLQERNYSQAAELLVKIQDWEQSAQVFEKAKIWNRASDCWENAGNFVNQKKTQAKGFEFSQLWEEAALLWEKLGMQEYAELCWLKIDNRNKKIEIISNQKSYFQKNVEHYETQNKQGVIQSSNDSIKVDPNLAESHYRKGNANYALGDNRLAIKEYDQAIKINPNFLEAYYNRAIVRLDLGDNEGAIEDCNQSIKINPNLAEVYYNRGLAFSNLGANQEAIKDYTKAIKINPNYSQAYINRGLAFLDLGYNQKAIEDYNRAIKINSNDEHAYYNKGLALYTLGQKEKAIKEYTQAIKINPNYSQAYVNRGAAFSDLGYNQKAIEDYNRAIEIDPNYCDAYYNRGNALSELGHKEEAIKDYTRAIQIDPHDAMAYTRRGNIYAELGDEQSDNAVMDFQRAANAFKRQGNLQDYQDSLKAIKTIRERYKNSNE